MATQHTLDFVLSRLSAACGLYGDDLTTALTFMTIVQGNVGHVDDDEDLYKSWSDLDAPLPDAARRPMSGYAAALQMGLPRETVRRKINALIARGAIVSTDDGYYAPASVLLTPELKRYSAGVFEASRDYMKSLHAIGLVSPEILAQARREPPRPRMVGRAVNIFVPAVLEPFQHLVGGELTTAVVFCAVAGIVLSHSPRPGDPAEARGAINPARRTVSALALSDRLGMPRETARRHVRHLVEAGLAADGFRGVFIPRDVRGSPRVQTAVDRANAQRVKFFERLARAGVLSAQSQPALALSA